ncbi:MAG TPA: L,D-transpeptidase [Acidimicrobiales bacterium]
MKRWLVALAAVLVLGVSACAGDEGTDAPFPETSATTVTAPVKPCDDDELPSGTSFTATAAFEGDLAIYDSPDPAAEPSRTLPNPRLFNNDPNAKVPLVFLVKDTPDDACDWVEVYLPVRPNGSTGFVKRSEVNIESNPYRIEVRLGEFKLKVFKADEVIMDTTIAEASDNTPTPGGTYFTTELVKTTNPGGAYGPYAYGLSGFSEVLQTFNGGPGQLGIHGTNQPQLLGQKVSNGCIRMSNEDITTLAGILPLGVPVQIIA